MIKKRAKSREQRVCRQGCGDMKHPQAIYFSLTSLTVKRQELSFYAVNFAAMQTGLWE